MSVEAHPLILTAHQPVYLPWLGLIHKIALSDAFVFFDDVQYQDRDWNNRNKINTPQGPLWLTVPVFNKDHYALKAKDVVICHDTPWKRKHFKSISIAYAKASFASRYIPFFDDLFKRDWEKLADLNDYILKFVLKEMGIRVQYSKLSDMHFQSQKSELVLEMCQHMKAGIYLFGALGKDYANQAAFEQAGVRLEFQDYRHPTYSQIHGKAFTSHLTVFDLQFNHGPASYDILMSGNLSRQDLLAKHLSNGLAISQMETRQK